MSNLSDQQHLQIEAWRALLLRAAERIETRGFWVPGAPQENGQACVAIAMHEAALYLDELGEACARFERALGFTSLSQVFAWNDSHSAADVIQKLREVATS